MSKIRRNKPRHKDSNVVYLSKRLSAIQINNRTVMLSRVGGFSLQEISEIALFIKKLDEV